MISLADTQWVLSVCPASRAPPSPPTGPDPEMLDLSKILFASFKTKIWFLISVKSTDIIKPSSHWMKLLTLNCFEQLMSLGILSIYESLFSFSTRALTGAQCLHGLTAPQGHFSFPLDRR